MAHGYVKLIFFGKKKSFGKKGISKLKEFLTGRSKEVEIIKKQLNILKIKVLNILKI